MVVVDISMMPLIIKRSWNQEAPKCLKERKIKRSEGFYEGGKKKCTS
jgi:hypothetical protein